MAGGGFGSFLTHSSVLSHLKDIDFPASKQDIINHAEDNHAPESVIKILEKIPDKVYNSVAELTEHL